MNSRSHSLDNGVIEATTNLSDAFQKQSAAVMKWSRATYSEEARYEVYLHAYLETITAALTAFLVTTAEGRKAKPGTRGAIPDFVKLLGYYMTDHADRIYSEVEAAQVFARVEAHAKETQNAGQG